MGLPLQRFTFAWHTIWMSGLREEVTHAASVERSPRTHPQRRGQPRGLPKEARRSVLRQRLDHYPLAPTPTPDRLVRAQAPWRRDRPMALRFFVQFLSPLPFGEASAAWDQLSAIASSR